MKILLFSVASTIRNASTKYKVRKYKVLPFHKLSTKTIVIKCEKYKHKKLRSDKFSPFLDLKGTGFR